MGVEVIPGRIMHATQYADDTQPLLTSLDPKVIQAFLDHMDVFRRASGQGLNPSKTRLLVIGNASAFDRHGRGLSEVTFLVQTSAGGLAGSGRTPPVAVATRTGTSAGL